MLTVAIPKRNKLQNIIVLTPKDGLRNNLCLPACKLLYLDKREKNFLLTDIISDIIIVRN